MIPDLAPHLQALMDGEGVDIREMLDDYPLVGVQLERSGFMRDGARLVAVDCLARLSECADRSLLKRLEILIARLHAWDARLVEK